MLRRGIIENEGRRGRRRPACRRVRGGLSQNHRGVANQQRESIGAFGLAAARYDMTRWHRRWRRGVGVARM